MPFEAARTCPSYWFRPMTYPNVKNTPENNSISKNRPITCLLSSTRSLAPRFPPEAMPYFVEPPRSTLPSSLIISIGSGKTIVVFFSTPISVKVCR